MERYTANDWQFGFWSSLSLELVARAAVAHVSPTLLAHRKDWRNIYDALGNPATAKGFTRISVTTTEVLQILKEILPDFTDELNNFCARHCANRNAELHSGEEVFAGLGTSEWLAKYYKCCQVFLGSMGRTLHELFGDVTTAKALIASLNDSAAKAVERDIKKQIEIWNAKPPQEEAAAVAQASAWATRHVGHRVKCPACGNPALLRGSSQGAVSTEIGEDVIVQRQTMLPSAFECVACDLKIAGLSKLSACGLGDAFTATSTYSPAEFFGLHTTDELEAAQGNWLEAEWEPDFNEY
jgi:hypothetical protein